MTIVPNVFFFFFILILILSPVLSPAEMTETEALLLLKKSFSNATTLNSWSPDSPPCGEKRPWVGILCLKGVVMGLRLGSIGLSGKIDVEALLHLPNLRSISFTHNSFLGPIPSFNRLGALKAIYISENQFSGEIPPDFFSKMDSLKKIWLPRNSFTGPIPTSLTKLTHLTELHLENNRFSGSIPSLEHPTLKSFNVSNNDLEGKIPVIFNKFNKTSFDGNVGLCGSQVGKPCAIAAAATPAETVADQGKTEGSSSSSSSSSSSNKVAVVFIVVVLLLCLVGLMVTSKTRQKEGELDKLGEPGGRNEGEEAVAVHVPESNRKESLLSIKKESSRNAKRKTTVPQLMMVNEEKGVFGLPDLMKAAAEVLGNGGLGSAYKAVMANGVAVVVKRMREMNRVGDDGFEAEMRRLGRLRHPNVLPLLAFHFRKEEKLMVYEFVPKGSLLYLLHVDHGPGHDELSGPVRLRIIRGIARGMAYIHTELASSELPHGNLKSSNVLIGTDLEPLLIDYGYSPFVTPTQASQSLFAYKSPESIQYNHVSHKSDVYCLGILILEILTGKLPSQYLTNGKSGTDVVQWVTSAVSEQRESDLFDPEISDTENLHESMELLLHLGVVCTEPNPEQRPDMSEALRRVEEIIAAGEDLLLRRQSVRQSYKEDNDGMEFTML